MPTPFIGVKSLRPLESHEGRPRPKLLSARLGHGLENVRLWMLRVSLLKARFD